MPLLFYHVGGSLIIYIFIHIITLKYILNENIFGIFFVTVFFINNLCLSNERGLQ